jgi:iron(III) transport system ATP-binding protein
MNIELRDLSKNFGPQRVVDRVSLTLYSGELFFLLGPSGCGKTTLLRMVAGFYEPDAGTIRFGERTMNGVPPQDRNTALVFQNYALWPHLTVFENVAYGLRLRQVPEPELTRRVEEALAQTRIAPCRDRKPGALSGGQQQRVALARALVVRPDLLLLDEPLSNLDARLRVEMREEIARLHCETGRTALYVTHDQEEALSIADRIAVINQGRVEQVGTPFEIYERPATAFVAAFMGEMNFQAAASPLARALGAIGGGGRIGFRPERVRLHADGAEGVAARVVRATFLGGRYRLVLHTADGETVQAFAADPLAEGTAVRFSVAPDHLLPFAA